MNRWKRIRIAVLLFAATSCLYAQETQPPVPPAGNQDQSQSGSVRHRGPQGDREGLREMFRNAISGSVQSVTTDGMTIKKLDGTVVTVKTTRDTMFRRERREAKLSDFKAGDQVIVAGDPAGENTVTAKFVAVRPSGPNAMNPEDLGKKFIVGEVLKIDETKLTIKRPDGVEQVIEVNDDTSFRNSKRESITLPDIKVGDHVMGRGAVTDGTFIPTELMVGMPQGFGMRRREGPPPDGAPKNQMISPGEQNTPNSTTPKRDQ